MGPGRCRAARQSSARAARARRRREHVVPARGRPRRDPFARVARRDVGGAPGVWRAGGCPRHHARVARRGVLPAPVRRRRGRRPVPIAPPGSPRDVGGSPRARHPDHRVVVRVPRLPRAPGDPRAGLPGPRGPRLPVFGSAETRARGGERRRHERRLRRHEGRRRHEDAVPKVRLAYTCNALAAWWCTLGTVAVAVAAFGDAPRVGGEPTRRTAHVRGAHRGPRLARRLRARHPHRRRRARHRPPRVRPLHGRRAKPARVRGQTRLEDVDRTEGELGHALPPHPRLRRQSPSTIRRRRSLLRRAPPRALALRQRVSKGEESVPFTWDVFHEKWGWMLIFWNLAGVPFAYSVNAAFVASRSRVETGPRASSPFSPRRLLRVGHAQSQRTRFRAQQGDVRAPPWAFPRLPWGTPRRPSDGD